MLLALLLALLLACARPALEAPETGRRVAITIDDLPWQRQPGRTPPSPDEIRAMNAAIRDALLEARAPAAVFFNGRDLAEGDGLVEAWAEAGFTVGNHTWSHTGLQRAPVEAWLEDAARMQAALEARVGEVRLFRYPFLQMGPDQSARDRAAAGLAGLGLRHAPVTVATSEWVLAFAWRNAAGDPAMQAEIAAALRQHLLEGLEVASALGRRITGREVAQITLLHANELVADQLDEILVDLRAAGWTLVSAEEALEDPLYRMEDRWTRSGGLSWLARVDPNFQPESYWFGQEEERLNARWLPELRPPPEVVVPKAE